MKERQPAPAETISRPERLTRNYDVTSVILPSESDGPEPDRTELECVSSEARGWSLTRVRELEAETRTLRAVLEVRNEALRTLMVRLVTLEVHACEVRDLSDRVRTVEKERDDAVLLAHALQNLKTLRYTRLLRELYRRIRSMWGL